MKNDVVTFIRNFIKQEFEAFIAQESEPDDEKYMLVKERVNKYFGMGLEPEIGRPERPDESWFSVGRKLLETGSIMPRTLFQVKKYRNLKYGSLYRAYLSLPEGKTAGGNRYFSSYIITYAENSIKIISRYDIDLISDQEGPRLVDGGLSWIHAGGVVLDELGEFERSWKIQPPDDPAHRDEYDRQ